MSATLRLCFDNGKDPWWSSQNTPSRVESGQLCAEVPAGTTNPWDSMIGQNDIPLEDGQPYTLRFTASASRDLTIRTTVQLAGPPYTTPLDQRPELTATLRTFEYTATSNVSDSHGQVTSYVTGYGERASHNQHHRFWAHQIDPSLPTPAPGSLAGGPNSGLQDPVAQRNLAGCAPATCYIDDIGSWSTNEVAINWNSSLAWIAAFADSL
ncbi:glycoside hydrolase family 9 protein [Nonomuraea sp. 3N208]|uniref:glycoside hydrolase family 9 protein n=1 Tax=Nonomuraea sp. 3N208 TaxID=3457421 RepID=UPI003FCF7CB6